MDPVMYWLLNVENPLRGMVVASLSAVYLFHVPPAKALSALRGVAAGFGLTAFVYWMALAVQFLGSL